MRRCVATVLLAFAALATTPAPAAADYGPDCDDFSSSEQAQDYYKSQGGVAGGDPDGLDRDQDGRACDWGAPPPDVDWTDSGSDAARFSGTDDSGLPWWAWAGGGLAGLWIIAAIRWNT